MALLGLAGARGVDRFEAAQTLWPDVHEQRARHNLSTALWRLKATDAGLAALLARDAGARIRPERGVRLLSDIMIFERLARDFLRHPAPPGPRQWHRAGRAEALYRGDALRDIDSDWADIERERLRSLYLDLLHAMAVARLDEGAVSEAIRLGQKLVALDPFREDVHRLLMRAHMKAGNRAKAILQYRICEGEISQSLGTAPMPETVALYQSLVALPDRRLPPAPDQRRSEYLAQAKAQMVDIVHGNMRAGEMLKQLQALIERAEQL